MKGAVRNRRVWTYFLSLGLLLAVNLSLGSHATGHT